MLDVFLLMGSSVGVRSSVPSTLRVHLALGNNRELATTMTSELTEQADFTSSVLQHELQWSS